MTTKMPIYRARVYFRTIAFLLLTGLSLNTTYLAQAQDSPGLSPNSTIPAEQSVPTSGNQISLNGRILSGAWFQKSATAGKVTTHISDAAVKQLLGVDLLNSNNPGLQPVQWFSSGTKPMVLDTKLLGGYRYLDITDLSQTAGWQIQVNGNILVISTPTAKVINIRRGKQPTGDRLVLDLDRPTPWQIRQESPAKKIVDPDAVGFGLKPNYEPEWRISLDGIADAVLLQRYNPKIPATNLQLPITKSTDPLIKKVEVVNNQTILTLRVPFGQSVQINTTDNPSRLVIDVRPDALVSRDITWAQGLRWQQRFVNLDQERFPVVSLEVDPRAFGLTIKPMWANLDTLGATAPLIQTAQRYLAVGGINGGYFNRNNKLPLGAIRRDNEWISGPILNRGAIAWNDSGEFYFGRLTLTETLKIDKNPPLPIILLNSGYIQKGIARYTPTWGNTYTPLSDNETIVVIQKNQVINQLSGGKAGVTAIPIPTDGYLLSIRDNATTIPSQLSIGTSVNITTATTPTDFSRYPHIIGAGPLLVQNRQIVLDAKAEKFSAAFIAEKAVRSGICTTSTGNLILAAVHNRPGGAGPTLAEHAKLMQAMGCVNALNLDGGSSTSLYLGGQLLNRSANTAARVHNGIGIFLEPKKSNEP